MYFMLIKFRRRFNTLLLGTTKLENKKKSMSFVLKKYCGKLCIGIGKMKIEKKYFMEIVS